MEDFAILKNFRNFLTPILFTSNRQFVENFFGYLQIVTWTKSSHSN